MYMITARLSVAHGCEESDYLLSAGSQGSGAETQSAVFQPADGHLPVGNGAGRPLEASANQTQPPSSTSAAAVSDLLGGFSQGGAGGQGSSAADLVAQLSQSGASAQMLFDAISALPQVSHLSCRPGEGLVACSLVSATPKLLWSNHLFGITIHS